MPAAGPSQINHQLSEQLHQLLWQQQEQPLQQPQVPSLPPQAQPPRPRARVAAAAQPPVPAPQQQRGVWMSAASLALLPQPYRGRPSSAFQAHVGRFGKLLLPTRDAGGGGNDGGTSASGWPPSLLQQGKRVEVGCLEVAGAALPPRGEVLAMLGLLGVAGVRRVRVTEGWQRVPS